MEAAVPRSSRLVPLRFLASVLLLAAGAGFARAVVQRNELLAEFPGLSPKLLATMLALTFVGALALAFLAFWRQRFGLWIVLACTASQLALETWAGFPLLTLARLPLVAALVFLAAHRAWPELRRASDVR